MRGLFSYRRLWSSKMPPLRGYLRGRLSNRFYGILPTDHTKLSHQEYFVLSMNWDHYFRTIKVLWESWLEDLGKCRIMRYSPDSGGQNPERYLPTPLACGICRDAAYNCLHTLRKQGSSHVLYNSVEFWWRCLQITHQKMKSLFSIRIPKLWFNLYKFKMAA